MSSGVGLKVSMVRILAMFGTAKAPVKGLYVGGSGLSYLKVYLSLQELNPQLPCATLNNLPVR